MAKQSKGFGKPVHIQKPETRDHQRLQEFAQKFANHPVSDQFAGNLLNPKGVARMSDVLEEFMEPYLPTAKNHTDREKLFTLGVVAWNTAIAPQAKRAKLVQAFLDLSPKTESVNEGIKEIVSEMIEHKLKFFANNHRSIVNIELVDQGDTFHLSVASTMP